MPDFTALHSDHISSHEHKTQHHSLSQHFAAFTAAISRLAESAAAINGEYDGVISRTELLQQRKTQVEMGKNASVVAACDDETLLREAAVLSAFCAARAELPRGDSDASRWTGRYDAVLDWLPEQLPFGLGA